jgi:hypothetical protein
VSGLVLPQSVGGTATGWALADYMPEVVLRSPKVAVGETTATAYGEQLPNDVLWLIDHAVTSCTSATATSLRMYSGAGGLLIDGTDEGNFQVADWPNGLQVAPGRQLVAVWSSADVGSVGTLALQVRVLRRTS